MLRAVRVSLVVQAVCLLAVLATLLPDFLERVTSVPVDCPPGESCFDPTGVAFVIYALIFIPIGAVLVATARLWQTNSRWPAIVPIAIDLMLIGGGISDLIYPREPANPSPPPTAELLLLVVPALLSLGLVLAFVGSLTWRRAQATPSDG